ncbi:uncharacterized protein LOC128986966 [Macrosteles quadrilineatus]|uniref:uncharacterized protein LOC128986966 n=1 Tax=Macrosteles quadrilineatus TaxID=74068 RepID=UPI0023E205F4|nr:uncharacterized protein LOC128986966 [Macrosteles quadrilineatus]
MFLYIILISSFTFVCCKKSVEDNKYTDLRSTFTYVDKTPLIYEMLRHKYVFLSVPSKFGKTSNLDMINLFLGRHHSKQDVEHYFVFTKIWESPEVVEAHMGKHPVVQFCLKLSGYSKDFEHTLSAFQVALYNAFSDHVHLLESKKLTDEQMRLMKLYTDYTKCRQMGTEMVAKGVSVLVEVLHKFHSKPVVLLADDFGAGITDGILQNHVDLMQIVEFYSSFLNHTFANQSLISHALFTAENRLRGVAGDKLLDRVGFMEKLEWSRFFGFTYAEAEHLLDKNVKNVTLKQKKEVMKWYCGYSSYDGAFKICNPYSIIEYIARKEEKAHWSGSALSYGLLRTMSKEETLKEKLHELYWRRTVDMKVPDVNKTLDLSVLAKEVSETPDKCVDFLVETLLEAGFVTPADEQERPRNVILKFPNEEVRAVVLKLIE